MVQHAEQKIAQSPVDLIVQVRNKLNGDGLTEDWSAFAGKGKIRGSAVMFLLTLYKFPGNDLPEPCLILNKRSKQVMQPGDLCCPGGGVEPFDHVLANIMRWPISPLSKWPQWRTTNRQMASTLSLLLSTGLREGWEEMRLNPLKVQFLGPLQVQKLIMFERLIYPLACWVPANQNFRPNWEVERIVMIPLRRLLETHRYARFRLSFVSMGTETQRKEDFPCYIHDDGTHGQEVLWGATFRIAMDFLERVYGFELPALDRAALVKRRLGSTYLNGSLLARDASGNGENSEDY